MFCFSFHQTLSTVFLSILLLFTSCNAAFVPSIHPQIVRRQDGNNSGVQTFTTTQQIPTEAGIFTEKCTIVITPITGANGEGLFRQEKSCTMSMDPGSGAGSSNGVASPSAPGGGEGLTTSTTTLTSLPTTGGTNSDPTPMPPTGVSTGGVSDGPKSNPSSAMPTSSPGGSSPAPNTPTLSPSGSPAAAAAESSTQTPFDPPGKSLQVLPIGLGVFGGISVIAIIIVGVVTYERTKHRRNFRNRKLAEAGAEMGYGGIAQAA